jgi:hypothetical protein
MDPAEQHLEGAAEARYRDPETGQAVVVRPQDWAGAYDRTVQDAIAGWRQALRQHGIGYEVITTDQPFGTALKQALVRSAAVTSSPSPRPGHCWAPRRGRPHPDSPARAAQAVVDFPAVRYLSDTARIHQRRLALRNWLLLLARTFLVVLLVLAAAGPTWPRAGAGGHAASALALVLDN